MSSSRYVGQLKQNNIQINSLRESNDRAEKHMLEHEQALTEKTNLFMEYQQNELKKHIDDKSNPHLVTKEQVGLGNVLNNAQATKEEFDAHLNDTLNPHSVTKSQVGLANVLNEKQATKTEFDAHIKDNERHTSNTERNKWNAGQLYKLTQDNGRVFYKTSSETTDYNELSDTGMYLIYNAGLNGPGLTQCFLLVMSSSNTLVQTAYDATNGLKSFYRIRKYDSVTWTPWVEIETVGGAQAKINAHANKTDIHVTKEDKGKWNAAQLSKISSDDGQPLVSITSDFHSELLNSPSLTYFAYDKAALGAPPINGYGFWTCSANKLYGQAIVLTNDNKTYRKSLINGAWSSWERLINSSEIDNVPWLSVTYKNGAKTGSRPLQYRKVAGTLQLSGHVVTNRDVVFASIPTEFSPKQGTVKSVEVSGTFGRSKLFINTNGDLQLSGVSADNSAAITGYYIDVVVPLN
ncbi:hypothetical protein C7M30_00250 [Bacillus subtilis]|uniref:pyocin knob domain-containing protein n=1 Tax=Bacillus subtilis TaxID=1423 RepID=UPI0013630630|nr:hypothetical protein C7M30_00250 [Bacillus subtilis]